MHENKMLTTGKVDYKGNTIMKPKCVLEYIYMGSVDKTDKLLSLVECLRKNVKRYKKIYFH